MESKREEPVVGVVFEPYDEEIISFLEDKLKGVLKQQHDYLKEFDLYGEEEPWLMFDKDANQNFYAFPRLRMKNKAMFKRTSGGGTWVSQKTEDVRDRWDGRHIGIKKLLIFTEGKKGSDAKSPPPSSSSRANGHWIMHEYSCLNQNLGDSSYVLCKIRNKNMEAATKGASS